VSGIDIEPTADTQPRDEDRRTSLLNRPNALAVGTVLAALVAWEVLAQIAFDRLTIVFPPLAEIARALVGLLGSGEFHGHFWITTQEVAISFALAAAIGILGGTALGSSDYVAKAVEPIIYYFSTVPKIVLYPLFIIALGAASMDSKIAMGFFSAIFPITVNTITGTLAVRADLVKVARMYQANPLQRLTKVYLPSIITHVVNGLRLGIGVAIIGVLLGELFASQAGIGNQVAFFFSNLQTDRMYAALIVVFAVALSINLGLLKLQDTLSKRGYGTSSESRGGLGF
jgi:ABC-type nitrate/sulfonate/bicarbonate transport system permease component